jgi:Ca2+-binding RTX toxin-like protein
MPGDDTDLDEGGPGTDTVEVNAGGGTEQFNAIANGLRTRLDRLNPAPFSIDIGTSEKLRLNTNGGDDVVTAAGLTDASPKLTVDGGAGSDTLRGGGGADLLLGGDGNDLVDGNRGDDLALLGPGDDRFQWDAGEDDDVVEGDAGADTLLFNSSGDDEVMTAASAGERVRFTRDVANVVMDLAGMESIHVQSFGGDDAVSASGLAGAHLSLAVEAGDGADVLVGGDAKDVLRGGLGDDVLIGGLGDDTLDGGASDDVVFDTLGANLVIAAIVVGKQWVQTHSRPVRGGGIVLELGGRQIALPAAELAKL